MVVHVEARSADDVPAPLWLLPALWLASAVLLDVAQHHRLADGGAMTVEGVIGAVGALWIVSGVFTATGAHAPWLVWSTRWPWSPA